MAVYDGGEELGPPFSTELLADLHAGVLPEDVSARLWPRVRQDPAALDVLAALDGVSAELRAVGRDHTVETPVPPEVAARIEEALARENSPLVHTTATVSALADARSRRRARTWISIAVASTAAAIGVVFTLSAVDGPERAVPSALATPTPEPTEPAVTDLGDHLDGPTVLALMGGPDAPGADGAGRLTDPQTRAACLQANGIDPSLPVLGTRAVEFRGTEAVLLLVAGPRPPALTALVVGGACAAGSPDLLTRTVIG